MSFRVLFLSLILSLIFFNHAAFAAFDANFYKCIAANEGAGGNPAVTNKWGYTGLYQMSVGYAAGAGLCSNSIPKMNTNQVWSTCNFDGKIAQKYGVKSYADFTTGPNAAAIQNELMQIGSQKTWNQIVKNGLDKYVGQTVNGVLMTKDTMVAMAHLKGYGGLQKTLQGNVTADGNGTTTTGYASCLASCMAGTSSGSCNMKSGVSDGVKFETNVCTPE